MKKVQDIHDTSEIETSKCDHRTWKTRDTGVHTINIGGERVVSGRGECVCVNL